MSARQLDEAAPGGANPKNPVFDGYFADPFVFFAEGRYYAVGTGPCPPSNLPMAFPTLVSDDLASWSPVGGALQRRDVGDRHYWAPEVAHVDGVYYMYYSVGVSDERHELRVATSREPAGPYVEAGRPLVDPSTTPFAIDPSPFLDRDGQWYLFYARDYLNSERDYRPGTGLAAARLLDMTTPAREHVVVTRARHDWQRYQPNRSIYGGSYDWHTVEGACVIMHRDQYYCLYSGGNWQNDTYGVDFVVADSPLGPWHDTNPGDGPRVLQTNRPHVIGPGHNSVVRSPAGNELIAYHAWDSDMTARRFCMDALIWTDDGPRAGSSYAGGVSHVAQ